MHRVLQGGCEPWGYQNMEGNQPQFTLYLHAQENPRRHFSIRLKLFKICEPQSLYMVVNCTLHNSRSNHTDAVFSGMSGEDNTFWYILQTFHHPNLTIF